MGSKLQNEIAHLSAAEKVELIDTLWESLEAEARHSRLNSVANLTAVLLITGAARRT